MKYTVVNTEHITHQLVGSWRRAGGLLILLLAVLFALGPDTVRAQNVPSVIAHQGRLLNATGAPITSTVTVNFALFDAATGGTQVWAETKPITPDTLGFYETLLGDTTPLPATVPTSSYLQLTVAGETLVPRLRLGSVPFALQSGGSTGVLAARYEFDETSGTQFADSSGFGNNATAPVGGIAVGSAGHSGKSINFSGGVVVVRLTHCPMSCPPSRLSAWPR